MESSIGETESLDSWKQFHGTELGGLLSSIYGNPNRVKINYPKPKQSTKNQDKKGFIPGGAALEASDPRKVTRRNVNVAVPKVCGRPSSEGLENTENIKPIDLIPKRKSASVIQVELDDIKMRQERYRPAHVKPISEDREKDRLNQIFTYKGGKGLPAELTFPISEAPFEIAEKKKEKDRLDAIRQKRGLMVVNNSKSTKALSNDELLAKQIQSEIEERSSHLEEMRRIGMKPQQEKSLERDLAIRLEELKKLEIKIDRSS
jgi:hypothetical protein